MRKFGLIAAALFLTALSAPASANPNLIVNGDFSLGNSGFSSGYQYVAPTHNSMYPEGLYTVASDPFSVHDLWVSIPGGNLQLIVNGATNSSTTPVWEEDGISTTKGGTYNFTADVTDICCNVNFGGTNAPSEITFQVSTDGGVSWSDIASHTTTPPDAGIANLIGGGFNSSAGGNFDIRAINTSTLPSGNDFAFDNIVVAAAPEPAAWAILLVGFFGLGAVVRRSTTQGVTA